MDGARFLDVRVARSYNTSDKTYYVVHEFVVSTLDDVLRDILRFVREHVKEVVLVRVQPRTNLRTDEPALELIDYINKFTDSFGKSIEDYSCAKTTEGNDFSQCGTIGDMARSGKRLLMTMEARSYPLSRPTNWFQWQEAALRDQWRASNKVETKHMVLINDLRRAIQNPKTGKVYNLQFILTPPGQDALWDQNNPLDAANGIVQSLRDPTLRELADMINPTLGQFVFSQLNDTERDFLTVITVDYYREYREELYSATRRLLEERRRKKRIQVEGECDGEWHTHTVPFNTGAYQLPGRFAGGNYELRVRAVGPRGNSMYLYPLRAIVPKRSELNIGSWS